MCSSKEDEPSHIDNVNRNAIEGLSPSSRDAVLALHNSFPPGEIRPVRGLLRTNFLILDGTPTPLEDDYLLGIFPTLSRANHDCTPNTNYFFSFPRFVGQFWATREIAGGEEVTIQYCELQLSRSERQLDLKSKYFFDCSCSTCMLSGPAVVQSNNARAKVGKLLEALQGYKYVKDSELDVAHPRTGADLAKKEGLAVHHAQILYYGAYHKLASGSHRILCKAMFTDARNAFRMVEGATSYNVQRVDRMLASLESGGSSR